MNKKLMLLAAGALTALAFAALPAVASAGEYQATCEENGMEKETCFGTITSSEPATLTDDSGSKAGAITCEKVGGNASVTNKSSTGTVKFVFTECKEEVFGTQCNNTGKSGEIVTPLFVTHGIRLEPGAETPAGVLLTGAAGTPEISVTFSCPSVFVTKTVTGTVIGQLSSCLTAQTHTITFGIKAAPKEGESEQQWTQITTAGAILDLTSGTHASDKTTSAQKGKGTINWGNTRVTFHC